MQLIIFTTVVIAAALPIIVSAAECSRSTAVKAPVDVVDVFGKISIVVYNAIEVAMKMPDASSSRLRKRAEVEVELGTTNCTANEKCLSLETTSGYVCYEENTTVVRTPESMSVTIKTGDIVLPNKAKANVFTNTQPLVDYVNQMSKEDGAKSFAPVAAQSAASSSYSSVSNATGAGKPPAIERAESDAAGKMVVSGGWIVAGTVALVAAVLA